MNSRFEWATPEVGRARNGIDVSSKGHSTYKIFSPFSHSSSYSIPVPGKESVRADSVEGIWQGLKIIDGVTDESLFHGRPKKRKGIPSGHRYEGFTWDNKPTLDYKSARKQIYVPAYVYHAVNNCVDSVKEDLEHRLQSGNVVIYDVDSNGSINDLSQPYSHASLLVDLLNVLKDSPLPPFNKTHFTYLDEQTDAAYAYLPELNGLQKELLWTVLTFAYRFSQDELKQSFGKHFIVAQGPSHLPAF